MKAIQMREPDTPDVLALVARPRSDMQSASEGLVRLQAAEHVPLAQAATA